MKGYLSEKQRNSEIVKKNETFAMCYRRFHVEVNGFHNKTQLLTIIRQETSSENNYFSPVGILN